MTDQEFNDRQAELLKDIPEELHFPIQAFAYEHGHGSGYHDVLSLTQDLVNIFEGPIERYGERMYEQAKRDYLG